MRALAPLLVLLPLMGCPASQAGCTVDNCRAMIEDCRVEFSGGPESIPECVGIDPPGRSITAELLEYCVEACKAGPGRGAIASCLGAKGAECRAARDAGFAAVDAVVASCDTGGGHIPDPSCEATCRSEQKACDTRCSGGDACDSCLRMGGSCASLCSTAGWEACLDCSAKCGVDYVGCSNRCPKAP